MKDNILHFKTKSEQVADFLLEAIQIAEDEGIDNIMIAMKYRDKERNVITGYCNLTQGEKMELVGHLQADIFDQMIRERYVED